MIFFFTVITLEDVWGKKEKNTQILVTLSIE